MDGNNQPVELVNQADAYGKTPLHIACMHKQSDVVSSLINAGADVDALDGNARTPLHHAMEILIPSQSTSRTLDQWKWDIKVENRMQDAIKISFNDTESVHFKKIVTLLIDAGADPNMRNSHGFTPLHFASMFWWKDLASLLVKAGGNLNVMDICDADLQDLDDRFEDIRKDSSGYTFNDPHGMQYRPNMNRTPLILATMSMTHAKLEIEAAYVSTEVTGRIKQMLSFLIDEGADVNIPDSTGRTALHNASIKGDDKIVKCLIDAGANVGAQDCDGMNALHYASQHGHKKIIQRLMSHSS